MKCEVPVHIWDVGNTKSPVEGGARSSVEETWDAANLTLENINIEKGKGDCSLKPRSIPHGLHKGHHCL